MISPHRRLRRFLDRTAITFKELHLIYFKILLIYDVDSLELNYSY